MQRDLGVKRVAPRTSDPGRRAELVLSLALFAALVGAAGCKATGTFACETSDQCRLGGGLGTCETTGYCSFDDSSCASGSRYDPLAGGGLAGTCVGDEPGSDAADAPDGPAGCTLWVAHYFEPCTLPAPPGSVQLVASGSPYRYDTTTGGGTLTDTNGAPITITNRVQSQAGGPDAALWIVSDLAIDATVELDVVGTKPLIIASWDIITVVGTIDASSHTGVRLGAGGNQSPCMPASAGTDGNSGTGGGGGGGFGGGGGSGGLGDANGTIKAGGSGGPAITQPAIAMAGCGGARSGIDTVSMLFAIGGAAGGGVVLAARTSITIDGVVAANGGGGTGDGSTTGAFGGGGGGSGGLIAFDAPIVKLSSAVVAANGGGGGAGGNIAGTGGQGTDGGPATTGAPGGSGVAGQGSSGGNGSSLAIPSGTTVTDATPAGGGGGGGGGAGYIVHWSATFDTTGSTVSPAPHAGQ